jgi:hypothetical protein
MPVGKDGRTGEVRESWLFVSPLIIVTSSSWSNGEVYRSKSRDTCTAHHYAQGRSAVGAELGSAHRSSANDGYAGALYIPLSHYPPCWRGIQNDNTRHYWPCISTAIQGDPYWGLARQVTAGGTLLPWDRSFYASSRRPRFEAWRLAGSSSGALIRAPMMLAAEVGGACVRAEERALLSLSLLEPLTRRVLVQSIPQYRYHYCTLVYFPYTTHQVDHQYSYSLS